MYLGTIVQSETFVCVTNPMIMQDLERQLMDLSAKDDAARAPFQCFFQPVVGPSLPKHGISNLIL